MKLPEQVEQLLEAPSICVLATTGPGNRPHAMPMWFLYEGGEIIFTCRRNAQKVKNIERTGTAVVVLDDRDPPYYAASLRGDASVGPPLEKDQWLRMATRYLDEERALAYASRKDWESVSIRVRPERVVEFPGIGD